MAITFGKIINEREVIVNKFNIAGVSEAAIANDIDYILHVEHELPMEWYTRLEAVKSDLVRNTIIHADAAVRNKLREAKYSISSQLQDTVGDVVMSSLGNTSETVIVDDSIGIDDL